MSFVRRKKGQTFIFIIIIIAVLFLFISHVFTDDVVSNELPNLLLCLCISVI